MCISTKRYLIGCLLLAGILFLFPTIVQSQDEQPEHQKNFDVYISDIQAQIEKAVDDVINMLDKTFNRLQRPHAQSGIYRDRQKLKETKVQKAKVSRIETSQDTLRRKQEELQKRVEEVQKQLEELRKQMREQTGKNRQEIEQQLDELQRTLESLQEQAAELREQIEEERSRAEEIYLEQYKDVIRFTGDVIIDKNDVIDGDVVVTSGDIAIYGRVTGDVVAVEGNIVVKDGGYIGGDAITVNGEITKEGNATIVGKEIHKGAHELEIEKEVSHEAKFTPKKKHWFPSDLDIDVGVVRYNRVDGIFLGLGSPKKYHWDGEKKYSLYGFIGYGFRSQSLNLGHWRGSLGFDRWFGNDYRFEVGFEGHTLTDTKDDWIINQHENSAAAFLIREDYRDYFGREGFSVHAAQYFTRDVRARVDYVIDRYSSLPNSTEWSLFGGDKTFRLNPEIDEGTMKSIVVSADYSHLYENRHWREGWVVRASAEFAGRGMGGNFDFNRYLLDARWYQPLSSRDDINVRIRIGSSERTLPYQKSYEIGGLGTLPAYDFKQFGGNRMLLGNIEYITNLRILDDLYFWPSGLFDGLNFIFFADAGWAQCVPEDKSFTEGFDGISWGDIKSDLGVAIGVNDAKIRLGLAWRTTEKAPLTVFFRITRPF